MQDNCLHAFHGTQRSFKSFTLYTINSILNFTVISFSMYNQRFILKIKFFFFFWLQNLSLSIFMTENSRSIVAVETLENKNKYNHFINNWVSWLSSTVYCTREERERPLIAAIQSCNECKKTRFRSSMECSTLSDMQLLLSLQIVHRRHNKIAPK